MVSAQGAMALSVFLDAEAKQSFIKIGRDQGHRQEIATLQGIVGAVNKQRIRAECRVKELTEDRDEVLGEAFERIDNLQESLAKKKAMLQRAYKAIEIWQQECEAARKEAERLKEENMILLQRLEPE